LLAELKAETQGQAQRRSAQAQRGRLRETPCTRGERSSLAALAVALLWRLAWIDGVNVEAGGPPLAVASCDCCFRGGEQDEDRVSLPASYPRLAVSKKEGCRGGNEAVTKLLAEPDQTRLSR
jgi:hypothetical protein